jgi:acetyl-CoA acetyltransferase
VTTAERARDLKQPPVDLLDIVCGVTGNIDPNFQPFVAYDGARHIMTSLWDRTGLRPTDIDVANLYDGFSSICMEWLEAAFCDQGEGAQLVEDSFDAATGELKIFGRIPMNPHGGNLSEGRIQGMGQVFEAVRQLRGHAGERQIPNVKHALITNGGNPINLGAILAAG